MIKIINTLILSSALQLLSPSGLMAERYLAANGPQSDFTGFLAVSMGTANIVHWQSLNVDWYLNASEVGSGLTFSQVQSAVDNAFNSWQNVYTSSITFNYQASTSAENDPNDGMNVLFWDENYPYGDNLAITRLSFNASEELTNVDIIFNSRTATWNVNGSNYDIEAVAAHEIGHMIGMAHSNVASATMHNPYTINWRTLDFDDEVGASFLYRGNLIRTNESFSGTDYYKWGLTVPLGNTLTTNATIHMISLASNASITVNGKLILGRGTTIYFPSGTNITVNGLITADGTPSQKITLEKSGSGKWQGIKIYSTGFGLTHLLNHCNIQNADTGIKLSNPGSMSATVSNCTFTDCTVGLDLYKQMTDVTITNNTFNGGGSGYDAIFGQFLPSALIIGPNNTIDGWYGGVDLDKQSVPFISGNTITDSGSEGIGCYGSSNPNIYKLGSDPPNLIQNSVFTNIYTDLVSLPFLGNDTGIPGNNQIINPFPDYLIYTEHTNVIYAQNNYWGSPNGPNELQFGGPNPHIFYTPYLTGPPTKAILPPPTTMILEQDPVSVSRDLFEQGYALYLAGQYEQAATAFDQAWRSSPQSVEAISALSLLDKSLVRWRDDPTASLDKLSEVAAAFAGTPLGGRASQFKTWRLIKAGRIQDAIAQAEAILNDYPQAEFQAYALHDIGTIYTRELDDPARGEAAFRSLISQYPDHRLANHARIELGEEPEIRPIVRGTTVQKNTPQSYALGASIPNPFNPATTIRYDLPEAVSVRLVIYNILGRRVVTLVDGMQQPGRYSVVWNGRDEHGRPVASGIYVYRLEAGSFRAVQKMTLLK